MSDLRRPFRDAVRSVLHDGEYRGTLGKLSSTGAYVLDVPGRPWRLYVLVQQGNAITPVDALNVSCPRIFGLPVIVSVNADGDREVRPDYLRASNFLGPSGPPLGTAFHSHRRGTGMEDITEPEQFQPGMVHIATGLNVTIEGFYYDTGAGVEAYFQTQTVDLTSYRPATAGYFAWAKIGFVKNTGAVVVVKSTDVSARSLLTDTLLAATQLTGGAKPIAAVALAYGQTVISNPSDIRDCKVWFSETVSYPTESLMDARTDLVTAGGALTITNTTSQALGFYTYSGAANGDAWTHRFFLRAGSYTFYVDGLMHPTFGKIDWSVDSAAIVSGQDWYISTPGGVYNVRKTASSITIPSSGWHKLAGVINGKNGSSSGYSRGLTTYGFYPSAD